MYPTWICKTEGKIWKFGKKILICIKPNEMIEISEMSNICHIKCHNKYSLIKKLIYSPHEVVFWSMGS